MADAAGPDALQKLARYERTLMNNHQTALRELKELQDGRVDPDTIGKVERGQVSPTVATLARIAHALAVPVAHLLDLHVDGHPEEPRDPGSSSDRGSVWWPARRPGLRGVSAARSAPDPAQNLRKPRRP